LARARLTPVSATKSAAADLRPAVMPNPHPLLQAALAVVPKALHPRLQHADGRGPTPRFDRDGWLAAGLWLVRRAISAASLRSADRLALDEQLTLVRQAIAGELDRDRMQRLRERRARSSRHVALKAAIWAGNEASWDMIYQGRPTRAAAACLARFLVRSQPSEASRLLLDLDALCVHLAALSACRQQSLDLPAPALDTPWRGFTRGRPTHYLIRLSTRAMVLLVGYLRDGFQWWEAHIGPEDAVLACVPDRHFAAAVSALHLSSDSELRSPRKREQIRAAPPSTGCARARPEP